MLTRLFAATAALSLFASAQVALGHGTPAEVTVVDGRLTITGNAPATPEGFSDQLLAETIAGSALAPVSQDRLFTDFPGVDVRGVAVGSGLWIEPILLDADPGPGVTPRGVWWWSPASDEIEPLDEAFRVDLISARGFGFTSLAPDEALAEPLELMEPLAVDLNDHRHPLYYVVPSGSAAPIGAFAFFARITSPTYESSAPFLIGLNHGLPAGQFVEAVQAINEAAGRIPGDYDYDGAVIPDDYLAWKNEYGKSGLDLAADGNQDGVVDGADYTVWRDRLMTAPAPSESRPVPEPTGRAIIALAAITMGVCRRS
ncbi:hypothetical protein [Botrimarina sp.]|uniref:hypothetical protein n=1 Tax=Botrimarina sp. TaxID=2795802 RepID=UPI0032EC1815